MHTQFIQVLSGQYGGIHDKESGYWPTIQGFNLSIQKILHEIEHLVDLHFDGRSVGVVREPGVAWFQSQTLTLFLTTSSALRLHHVVSK